eukprot:403374996
MVNDISMIKSQFIIVVSVHPHFPEIVPLGSCSIISSNTICFLGSLSGLPATVTNLGFPIVSDIPHSSCNSLKHASAGSSLQSTNPPGKARQSLKGSRITSN